MTVASARTWEVRSSRDGSDWSFQRETQVVSQLRFTVFQNFQSPTEQDTELYQNSGIPAAIATDTSKDLPVWWKSAHSLTTRAHVISQDPQRQIRQRSGCDAGRSRKQQRTVARLAAVLTITEHNVRLLIFDLRQCRCKILAFGTEEHETWTYSLVLGAYLQSWKVATVVFCWTLMTKLAAYFQADTSHLMNELFSQFPRSSKVNSQHSEANKCTPSGITIALHYNHDVTNPAADRRTFLLHI